MEEDILYNYQKLNENIVLVEKDINNRKALKDVEFYFKKVFNSISLLLITNKERYYGWLLMSCNLNIEFNSNFCASVCIDTKPFTMNINPLLLGKYSIKEMIYIISHELEHIVLNHPAESIRLNPTGGSVRRLRLNYAMDASINDRLTYEFEKNQIEIMSEPKDLITVHYIEILSKKRLENLKDFKYYFDILPNPDEINVVSPYEGYTVSSKNKKEGTVLHKWGDSDDPNQIEEVIKSGIREALDSLTEEEKANLPAYQIEAIKRLLEPPTICWSQVLKKYIGTLPSHLRSTKTRLSRRQPDRYDISGKIRNREAKIVVAIDTSGSMSSSMLEKLFNEIFSIVKNVDHEITVIECDNRIHKVYKAKKYGDLNLEINGRGGTSFTPVIEYINEHREYRDSVLVYFTDGIGDYEIPKPLVNKMLWVLLPGNYGLSVCNPYGEIIEMLQD